MKLNWHTSFKWIKAAVLLFSPIFITACGDDEPQWSTGNNGGSAPAEVSARMETPRTLSDGSTIIVSHDITLNGKRVNTYELEFDKTKLHSRWVAFRFDGITRARTVGRSPEPFKDDPSLSSSFYIGSNGFGGDYNRGHLCASEDRVYNSTANEQTFYMSNMSPQLRSFNQGYWVTLESRVQTKGRDANFADTLYVVKGGTIKDNQILSYLTRPNGRKVPVPKYYYMALLKIKNGVYSSIAFWMEHKEYGYSYEHKAPLSEIMKHAISVNELEKLTGIDFFPNLPDAAEEKIEDQKNTSAW